MALARSRALVLAVAFACTASAAHAAAPPIQQQMSTEEFKATGLDKLSPDELARLNTWLGRTIETEAAKAAVAAKKKVEDDNRGFFNFGSTDPIKSAITGEFRGFGQGRVYTLDNGQAWRQIDEASLAGVRLTHPDVVVSPSLVGNAWYFAVKGYGTRAKVIRVK
ncbi:hypothetical protein [Cognatilysobacter lacus]|uniref:Secreted protein n=1 Tax=Cognatilysobacter lacus TaxID=1643323 RepID=A0A5D8Z788_9GAMM|nr:hypothetical protein [Lysobacter lacus]TZF88544.1 hypothetical protein FW784_09705 [Lysobacter lacus]